MPNKISQAQHSTTQPTIVQLAAQTINSTQQLPNTSTHANYKRRLEGTKREPQKMPTSPNEELPTDDATDHRRRGRKHEG